MTGALVRALTVPSTPHQRGEMNDFEDELDPFLLKHSQVCCLGCLNLSAQVECYCLHGDTAFDFRSTSRTQTATITPAPIGTRIQTYNELQNNCTAPVQYHIDVIRLTLVGYCNGQRMETERSLLNISKTRQAANAKIRKRVQVIVTVMGGISGRNTTL